MINSRIILSLSGWFTPRALTTAEVKGTVDDYIHCAEVKSLGEEERERGRGREEEGEGEGEGEGERERGSVINPP
jgi:hypothetical protein